MHKCNACGALSSDVHVLEAEGGPMPDRGVVAVRIKICNSCYSRPERSQLLTRLFAEILVAPAYWFGRTIAWSSTIPLKNLVVNSVSSEAGLPRTALASYQSSNSGISSARNLLFPLVAALVTVFQNVGRNRQRFRLDLNQ